MTPRARTLARARRRFESRQGMTLFEVMVALAIFAGSLAVITQIISVGSRASIQAQLESDGVLRAETKLAEAVAGVIGMQSASGTYEDDSAWSWALTVTAGPQTNTLLLTMVASHTNRDQVDANITLNRIIRDPQIYADAAATSTTSGLELLQ